MEREGDSVSHMTVRHCVRAAEDESIVPIPNAAAGERPVFAAVRDCDMIASHVGRTLN